jgi:hypothetical protein
MLSKIKLRSIWSSQSDGYLELYILDSNTVAAQSKSRAVLTPSNSGIVGSNPTQGMDVFVCVYAVFVLSCVQVAALRLADLSFMESHRLCKKVYETEEQARAQERAVESLINEWMNEWTNKRI